MSAAGKIVVLADDLSGAAELAGIAYSHGLSAEVQRQFDADTAADVIAVDCDSRSLPEPAAAERTRAIAAHVAATRPEWIFKKVDSVLRGHVRAEIEAILGVTGHQCALLIPANPSRGRIIDQGRYLVSGAPLDQTEFARDPEFPRRSADVTELLGCNLPPNHIIVPDVASLGDLQQQASCLDDQTLAAGAADFFAACLDHFQPSRSMMDRQSPSPQIAAPALLVCGSPFARSQREAECRAAGVEVLTIGAEPLGLELIAAAAVTRLSSAAALALVVDAAPSSMGSGVSLPLLASIAAAVQDRVALKTLLAEGGATAAALCERLGWNRLSVTDRAPAGVGVLAPLAAGQELRFLIKPGSYPWPAEIWQPFCRLGTEQV